ncbi:hypothetical protein IGI04_008002 [Brassica rapa subsp. trilocularis]|uniref:Senescence domain-containing protein n=1 Tax=Brassica rapa subsp. trilocularis TaxID=1813537 RepID=A0ABQ7NLC8_BRACM|nr:hypothetical protein IGI04_025971 [Brassica rapa subsp. trilocularis]KAG5411683.1 hypothetical protein IGI04_008002 [Brassica rapa subsp. trilocularis]
MVGVREGRRGEGEREMMMILMSLMMKIGEVLRERVGRRRGEGGAGVTGLMILIRLRMMQVVEGRSVGTKWQLLPTLMSQAMMKIHALGGVLLRGAAVAAAAIAGRYGIHSWQAFKARPIVPRMRKFYEGGFQAAMTQALAGHNHLEVNQPSNCLHSSNISCKKAWCMG